MIDVFTNFFSFFFFKWQPFKSNITQFQDTGPLTKNICSQILNNNNNKKQKITFELFYKTFLLREVII